MRGASLQEKWIPHKPSERATANHVGCDGSKHDPGLRTCSQSAQDREAFRGSLKDFVLKKSTQDYGDSDERVSQLLSPAVFVIL